MKQANVSRLEQRTDLLLSTLQKCVVALGGKLELVATFPAVVEELRDFLSGHYTDNEGAS